VTTPGTGGRWRPAPLAGSTTGGAQPIRHGPGPRPPTVGRPPGTGTCTRRQRPARRQPTLAEPVARQGRRQRAGRARSSRPPGSRWSPTPVGDGEGATHRSHRTQAGPCRSATTGDEHGGDGQDQPTEEARVPCGTHGGGDRHEGCLDQERRRQVRLVVDDRVGDLRTVSTLHLGPGRRQGVVEAGGVRVVGPQRELSRLARNDHTAVVGPIASRAPASRARVWCPGAQDGHQDHGHRHQRRRSTGRRNHHQGEADGRGEGDSGEEHPHRRRRPHGQGQTHDQAAETRRAPGPIRVGAAPVEGRSVVEALIVDGRGHHRPSAPPSTV